MILFNHSEVDSTGGFAAATHDKGVPYNSGVGAALAC
jgi:hypothetical protein